MPILPNNGPWPASTQLLKSTYLLFLQIHYTISYPLAGPSLLSVTSFSSALPFFFSLPHPSLSCSASMALCRASQVRPNFHQWLGIDLRH
ncbi:hypothetical protein ACKVWC_011571 [Pyricularia oryzae]